MFVCFSPSHAREGGKKNALKPHAGGEEGGEGGKKKMGQREEKNYHATFKKNYNKK